jgi:hypothetical protein
MSPRLATERSISWSFVGSPVTTRLEMARGMAAVKNGRCVFYHPDRGAKPPLDRHKYNGLLNDSVFCPAPMGNVMLESWRLYEALEAGAIPLVERRTFFDYYKNLFGDHPIPSFTSWADAGRFAKRYIENQVELVNLQIRVLDWWLQEKEKLRRRFDVFLEDGMNFRWRGSLTQFADERAAIANRLWQYSELLKHHNRHALLYRTRIIAKRMLKGRSVVAHSGHDTQ